MSILTWVKELAVPLENVWKYFEGLEDRIAKFLKTDAPAEFVAALKLVITDGKAVFVAVTAAIAARGENWAQDGTAVTAVETFVASFKALSITSAKDFAELEAAIDDTAPATAAPVVEPVTPIVEEPVAPVVEAPVSTGTEAPVASTEGAAIDE